MSAFCCCTTNAGRRRCALTNWPSRSDDRPHPEGIAVLGDDFYCLPSDLGSGRPAAAVVPVERALAAVLRAHYIGQAARFVGVYAPASRLGTRILWAGATDALDNSLWWAGKARWHEETEGAGAADAAMVLESFRTVDLGVDPAHFGRRQRASGMDGRRESCCFSYLLSSDCDGCPSTCPKS